MDRMKLVGVAIAMFVFLACATVPPEAQVKTPTLAKSGDTVQLFHSGNMLAKDEFCLDAVVTVYRYSQSDTGVSQKSEVGAIRVTGFVGDHYLTGVVVKGAIKDNDIAVQPNSACLIKIPDGIIGSDYKIP
jgi:hypothetical protein